MAFFVAESKDQSQSEDVEDRLDLSLIAIGKKIGLDFSEINELRSSDLLELAKRYMGANDDTPREATQADIDRFFG